MGKQPESSCRLVGPRARAGHTLKACGLALGLLIGCGASSHDAFERHYTHAVALTREGRTLEAVEAYRNAIAASPSSADAYNNLGVALYHLGDGHGAIAAYRRAVALRPAFAEAHNNLGVALLADSRTVEAVAHFRSASVAQPRFAAARFNLCLALEILGQLEEALRQCLEAKGLAPEEPGLAGAIERLQVKLHDR
jgi:Flp pilus assembly protein TadD